MPLNSVESLIIILVVAVSTFATRVAPFVLFPRKRDVPNTMKYLAKVLTPAIISVLVIYCFRHTNLSMPYAELIASSVVIILHLALRNNLLSIGAGTVTYMLLIQYVFV